MENGGLVKRSFVKGAAILGIAGLLCKIIGAFFRIPLYNMLGDGMVYYEAVYPWYSTLLVVSSSGLPTAISKLVAERATLGDYAGAKRVFRKAQFLLLIIGLVTTSLMFFGADAIAELQQTGPGAALSFRALAPALFFVSLMCAYRGYLQGMQLMAGTAVSQLMEQAGKLGIGLFLAKALMPRGLEYAAMGALIGVTASELLALIIVACFYWARRRGFMPANAVRTGEREEGIVGKLLAIAIPVTIGASIMPLTGIVDSTMIMRLLLRLGMSEAAASMRYVALRTNVTSIINMPAVLTVSLAMSLVPAISAARARHDARGIHAASRMGVKLAMLIGLPCAAGLFALSAPIIDLLYTIDGERLAIAARLMRVSAVGVIFLSLVQTLTGIIQGVGRPRVPVRNLAIGAAVKVVVMLLLMRNPEIEIQGAAVSTVCCYAVAGILDLLYLVRKTRLTLNIADCFLKPLFASLLMALCAFFTYGFLLSRASARIATLGAVALAALCYIALIFLLRMFTKEDLAFIPGGKKLARILYGGK